MSFSVYRDDDSGQRLMKHTKTKHPVNNDSKISPSNQSLLATDSIATDLNTVPIHPPKQSSEAAGNRKKRRKSPVVYRQPSRPLSAYNIFFRDQRRKLLCEREMAATRDGRTGAPEPSSQSENSKQPPRLFETMAKTIGKAWRELSTEERDKYKDLAAAETSRYKKEVEEYREGIVQESKAAAKLKVEEQRQQGKRQKTSSEITFSASSSESCGRVTPSQLLDSTRRSGLPWEERHKSPGNSRKDAREEQRHQSSFVDRVRDGSLPRASQCSEQLRSTPAHRRLSSNHVPAPGVAAASGEVSQHVSFGLLPEVPGRGLANSYQMTTQRDREIAEAGRGHEVLGMTQPFSLVSPVQDLARILMPRMGLEQSPGAFDSVNMQSIDTRATHQEPGMQQLLMYQLLLQTTRERNRLALLRQALNCGETGQIFGSLLLHDVSFRQQPINPWHLLFLRQGRSEPQTTSRSQDSFISPQDPG